VPSNLNNKYNAIVLAALVVSGPSLAADKPPAKAAPGTKAAIRPCESVTVDPPTFLVLGKSRVIRLTTPVARIIVGGQASSRTGRPAGAAPAGGTMGGPTTGPTAMPMQPAAAQAPGSAAGGVADVDITLLSPTELFFLGKGSGSMNVVLQSADGRCIVKDIIVTIDPETLQAKLGELMPEEGGVKVRSASNSLILTGNVSDAVKLEHVLSLATSYGEGNKIVNLLRINTPQQVMLEVKIAEVSKTLLDRFGLDFSRLVTSSDGLTSSIITGIVGGAAGLLGQFKSDFAFGAIGGNASTNVAAGSSNSSAFVGSTDTTIVQNPDGSFSRKITISPGAIGKSAKLLSVDALKKDGVLRVLAEPNIMAISGQVASFLSGGKIFIPVAQNNTAGGTTISLEEKEFGVGLKFTPTVLDGTRINLKLVSEVSDLSQTGTPFTTIGGVTSVLPSMSTRRVDTTVQLNDGQSFVVAGLIKNNFNEALSKFPGLGEVPVMGALFRSTEFQTDQTELMFVVTPRLVKPLLSAVALPTDNHIVPTRGDVHLMGTGEGKDPAPAAKP
jgi:pilus assembly protein CpaC